jgi:hypothetical protein
VNHQNSTGAKNMAATTPTNATAAIIRSKRQCCFPTPMACCPMPVKVLKLIFIYFKNLFCVEFFDISDYIIWKFDKV